MSEPNHNRDQLEQLVEAFVNQPIPDGPAPDVQERLLQSLSDSTTTLSVPTWRSKSMQKILSTAALIVVVLGVSLYGPLANDREPGAAFAAMLEQIKKVRSATFVVHARLDGTEEMTVVRVSLLEPGWMRQEILTNGELKAIQILNQDDGKMLTLDPVAMTATILDLSGLPKNPQQATIVESLKKLPKDVAVFQGPETVDDISALKYVYDMSGMSYIVWIREDSKMPLKISMSDHADPQQATLHFTMTDFVWDAEVDQSLFKLEPPSDYTLQKTEINLGRGTEEDFVALLGFYARMNNGKFADAWNALTPATIGKLMTLPEGTDDEKKAFAAKQLAAAFSKRTEDLSEEQQDAITTEFQQVAIAGAVYFSRLLEANDWHYQGKGVALGDAEKIVAWWSPKEDHADADASAESKTAQVLYGDLRIEELPVDQLPKQ